LAVSALDSQVSTSLQAMEVDAMVPKSKTSPEIDP
jgi:hypothetical protein